MTAGAALDALDFPRPPFAGARVLTAAQARDLDRWAETELRMPGIVLMENAARAVAAVAKEIARGGEAWILAGPGNNGGDGLAAARLLAPRARVALFAPPDPARARDAATQLAIVRAAGIPIVDHPERFAAGSMARPGVVIDALLGTGLVRAVTGAMAEWIAWIDRQVGVPVLAVDVPSGMDADTGAALGAAPRAHTTVTFARAKRGLLSPAGQALAGRVLIASIGIPEPALRARLGED